MSSSGALPFMNLENSTRKTRTSVSAARSRAGPRKKGEADRKSQRSPLMERPLLLLLLPQLLLLRGQQ